jgi:tRNA(Arg) A34 adenosine deaminase TadA/CheY-like chemotaxis protein
MSDTPHITILIAEDNDMTRDVMSSLLQAQGYKTIGARDGSSAIEMVQAEKCDMAIVDINMAPSGGFEFVKYLNANGIKMPVVIITADDTSDMLVEANNLGVARVLQKPVLPDRLIDTISRILKKHGFQTGALASETRAIVHRPEELMARAIEIAKTNHTSGRGGPFGAIVADEDGKVISEGRNGRASRSDPLAHAEVMAIRQAAEALGRTSLMDCTLYISSEPTDVGKALIKSVGIQKVYVALSRAELAAAFSGAQKAGGTPPADPSYESLGTDAATEMFKTLS